jgi:hypothetical protein
MPAQYGGAYSPLRSSRPSGLFISTSPGFTWGNGCYITSLSFGLSAAIYGRCGVVAEADPTGRPFPIAAARRSDSSMAKSVSEIRFEARPMKAGSNWMVVITFPDRTEMHVDDFPEEADAKSWITNDSREWLGKLGYR